VIDRDPERDLIDRLADALRIVGIERVAAELLELEPFEHAFVLRKVGEPGASLLGGLLEELAQRPQLIGGANGSRLPHARGV
jgi:hypothetical protein